MDFEAAFARLLEGAAQDMQKDFAIQRDTLVEGRWVAMEARFDMTFERKPFGLIPTGNMTHSHEVCLFVPVPTLDEAQLTQLLEYLSRVQDTQVQLDKWHEFTMVTLVIATEQMDRALVKPLRRHHDQREYPAPNTGWSLARVAVIDLTARKAHVNADGKPVADRMSATLKRL